MRRAANKTVMTKNWPSNSPYYAKMLIPRVWSFGRGALVDLADSHARPLSATAVMFGTETHPSLPERRQTHLVQISLNVQPLPVDGGIKRAK